MSLDGDALGGVDGGEEEVRRDRAELRSRLLAAAYDAALLQTCPEVKALADKVAKLWSPSGLDLEGSSDSEPAEEQGEREADMAEEGMGQSLQALAG